MRRSEFRWSPRGLVQIPLMRGPPFHRRRHGCDDDDDNDEGSGETCLGATATVYVHLHEGRQAVSGWLAEPQILSAMNSITSIYVATYSQTVRVGSSSCLQRHYSKGERAAGAPAIALFLLQFLFVAGCVEVQVQVPTQEEGTVSSCCPPASRSLACFTTPVPQPRGPAPRSASCRRSSRLARVVQHSQRSGPRLFCSRREPRGFLSTADCSGPGRDPVPFDSPVTRCLHGQTTRKRASRAEPRLEKARPSSFSPRRLVVQAPCPIFLPIPQSRHATVSRPVVMQSGEAAAVESTDSLYGAHCCTMRP